MVPSSAAAVVDGPLAAWIHPKRWAIPTPAISATPAARNSPAGSISFPIHAIRLRRGEREFLVAEPLVVEAFVDIGEILARGMKDREAFARSHYPFNSRATLVIVQVETRTVQTA
jgi:hypothetical protein